MKSSTTPGFRRRLRELPPPARRLARKNFKLRMCDPHHPSLHFKKVGRFWSARVGGGFRALAVVQNNQVEWFWIGPHDEYDRLLKSWVQNPSLDRVISLPPLRKANSFYLSFLWQNISDPAREEGGYRISGRAPLQQIGRDSWHRPAPSARRPGIPPRAGRLPYSRVLPVCPDWL